MKKFILSLCPYKSLAVLLICNVIFWANYILALYIHGKISIEIIKNIAAGLGFLATLAGSLGIGSKAGKFFPKNDSTQSTNEIKQ